MSLNKFNHYKSIEINASLLNQDLAENVNRILHKEKKGPHGHFLLITKVNKLKIVKLRVIFNSFFYYSFYISVEDLS